MKRIDKPFGGTTENRQVGDEASLGDFEFDGQALRPDPKPSGSFHIGW